MASRNFDATPDPQALETTLALTIGQVYELQNVDAKARLRLRVAAVKPAPTTRSHLIGPGEHVAVGPVVGVRTWCWTDDLTGCAAIVTEGI